MNEQTLLTLHQKQLLSIEERIASAASVDYKGRVRRVVGMVIEADGPRLPIGSFCSILSPVGKKLGSAEVVGFAPDGISLMAYGNLQGISAGCIVRKQSDMNLVPVGDQLLGKVVDPFCNILNSDSKITFSDHYPLHAQPVNPLARKRISNVLDVGMKAVNGLLTVGKGQRIGIFAGSGVGKSTTLGMMARHTNSDVNVLALIGERGREVSEFIEKDLGPALNKSVVVVATSDSSPLERVRGAYTAMSIAEYFCDQGKDVLLMMDSVTRFAMAQREIGLSVGEPPTTKGYTPSVFALLPKLLERAGSFQKKGSITGFFTVLVEGDDFNEPISDAARAILDGHIYLSREIANRGHYPAIDILGSLSRLMSDLVSPQHYKAAMKMVKTVSVYQKAEDLINIGAYVKGSNPEIDYAIQKIDSINTFLTQEKEQGFNFANTGDRLLQIMEG